MVKSSQKNMVMEYIKSLGENINSFKVLSLNLHLLAPKILTDQNIKSLREVFIPAVKNGMKVFDLPNGDIITVFAKSLNDEILSALVKIKFLLQEDERVAKAAYLQDCEIADIWDMVKNYASINEKLSSVYNNTDDDNTLPAETKINNFDNLPKHGGEKLTTAMLDKVQKIIAVSDFSSFIRRQSICAVIGKSMPQRVFEEVYVSISDMRDSLLPNVDVFSDKWLFLALTEALDRRVLEIISRHDDGSLRSNFSVNINVATILSDDFLRFDETIDNSQRKSIMLELQLADIFSDMRSYNLAKTFAQSRGYKICIDGITVDKLAYLNRRNLDCDLMKIVWHPEFVRLVGSDKHFIDYANKAERAKIILCRIDDAKAVEIGNSLGINLYQGRYIQKLLSADKR